MRNRDNPRPAKIAERQIETAGKRAFHRVPKLLKSQQKLQADFHENQANKKTPLSRSPIGG